MIYCSDATEDCTLCYDAFIKGQVVRQLPCGHVYHCVCIDKWLMRAARPRSTALPLYAVRIRHCHLAHE